MREGKGSREEEAGRMEEGREKMEEEGREGQRGKGGR